MTAMTYCTRRSLCTSAISRLLYLCLSVVLFRKFPHTNLLFCSFTFVQEPVTDRQLIESSPVLQKLTDFETVIGVFFTHVRLLARAFTLRTVGFNHLTLYA
ncbi:ribonuclease 3 isoform X1 [Tachysurus ichikawai]